MVRREVTEKMLTVVLAGKSEIASLCLRYMMYIVNDVRNDLNLLALPSKSDREIKGFPTSFSSEAAKLKVDLIKNIEELYSVKNLVFVSLEYDRIIRPERFASSRLYNIHFSMLPKYRGVFTSILPILNGESQSGVTLHEIDSGIDTGPIICQESFSIERKDALNLYREYNRVGFRIFAKNILRLIDNEYDVREQNHNDATYYSRQSVDFSICNLKEDDLRKYDAYDIDRIVRAFYFPEYQTATFEGRQIRRSIVLENDFHNGSKVTFIDHSYAILACKTGQVYLEFID